MGVPAVYTFRISDNVDLQVFLLSVRNNSGWSKEYLNVLRKICKNYVGEKNMVVLVICESEYQAMECAKRRNCEKELQELKVFYVTDTSILSENRVFNRLIDIQPDDDYSNRSTFRLEI